MITAIVQFQLGEDATTEMAASIFRSTAPRYLGKAGLIRKYYIFNPETRKGGGCYLLEDKAAAEAVFDAEWRATVTKKYGSAPETTFFDTPVVVDNVRNEIIGLEAI
jgi:hypothetical protein